MTRTPIIALVLLALEMPSQAAFLDDGWGARPIGMGGAFSAVADDSNAPLFNPAGIVQVQWHEVSAMYARLFSGLTLYANNDTVHLDQSYLSYVSKPISHVGSFGVSWANFTTTHLYREDTLALSYARNLGDFFPVFDNKLAMGMNLKYLRRGITLDSLTASDPVFASRDTVQNVTFDLGLLYRPDEGVLSGLRLALVGKNLTEPNMGFGSVDKVPSEWRFGTAYQWKQYSWLVPALDLTRRNSVTGVHAGVESWLFHDMLGLRTGLNRDEVSAGLSYYQAFSKKMGFRFDYAFTVPFYVQDTNGSHRLALTVYF